MLFFPIIIQNALVPYAYAEEQFIPIDGNSLVPENANIVGTTTPEETFSTSTLIYQLWGKEDGDRMIQILTCESGMKQFADSGKVIRSPTSDIGISQINQVWWDKAIELGYDINKTVDNLEMARYIWGIQGFKAWVCSGIVGVV